MDPANLQHIGATSIAHQLAAGDAIGASRHVTRMVQHGVTDELFRVFARARPEVELVATHMTPRIAALVQSAQKG
jgi:hypothetical protein